MLVDPALIFPRQAGLVNLLQPRIELITSKIEKVEIKCNVCKCNVLKSPVCVCVC